MIKKAVSVLICLFVLLSSYDAAFADDNVVPDGLPAVYPITIDRDVASNAVPAPKECFLSKDDDNAVEGLVCYLVGKVIKTEDLETGAAPMHAFTLQTEYGYVSIHDTYTFMTDIYTGSMLFSVIEPDSDYSFPNEGEFVKVICIYAGYSESEKKPFFIYGLPREVMANYHPEESTLEPTPIVERLTSGQSNALRKAKQYLEVMPFSYSGLIEQLEYEAFDHDAAVYATDHCGADWNEQAVKKAEKYLSIMGFSRDGLISQLQHDGFTYDQAAYGADQNGL